MRIYTLLTASFVSGFGFACSAQAACTLPSGAYSGAASGLIYAGTASPTGVNEEILIDSFKNGGAATFKIKSPAFQGYSAVVTSTGKVTIQSFDKDTCVGVIAFSPTSTRCEGLGCGPSVALPSSSTTAEFLSTQDGAVVTFTDVGTAPQTFAVTLELRRR